MSLFKSEKLDLETQKKIDQGFNELKAAIGLNTGSVQETIAKSKNAKFKKDPDAVETSYVHFIDNLKKDAKKINAAEAKNLLTNLDAFILLISESTKLQEHIGTLRKMDPQPINIAMLAMLLKTKVNNFVAYSAGAKDFVSNAEHGKDAIILLMTLKTTNELIEKPSIKTLTAATDGIERLGNRLMGVLETVNKNKVNPVFKAIIAVQAIVTSVVGNVCSRIPSLAAVGTKLSVMSRSLFSYLENISAKRVEKLVGQHALVEKMWGEQVFHGALTKEVRAIPGSKIDEDLAALAGADRKPSARP
jgi:hypothetical protein